MYTLDELDEIANYYYEEGSQDDGLEELLEIEIEEMTLLSRWMTAHLEAKALQAQYEMNYGSLPVRSFEATARKPKEVTREFNICQETSLSA